MGEERVKVRCGNCGTYLLEAPDQPPTERQPCLVCGSLTRNFHVALSASITSASVHAGVTRPPELPARHDHELTLGWIELGNGAWLLLVYKDGVPIAMMADYNRKMCFSQSRSRCCRLCARRARAGESLSRTY